MKKSLCAALIALACLLGAAASFYAASPKGDTRESREALLNQAIAKGQGWSIATEVEIDGYLVCGAYSADGKATIAVFEPQSKGRYRFQSSTNREREEIILGGASIQGQWYDLFWFNGAQTQYAEIVYTVKGQKQEPLRYDTGNMDLICIPNGEKEYSLDLCYVDSDGNKYE